MNESVTLEPAIEPEENQYIIHYVAVNKGDLLAPADINHHMEKVLTEFGLQPVIGQVRTVPPGDDQQPQVFVEDDSATGNGTLVPVGDLVAAWQTLQFALDYDNWEPLAADDEPAVRISRLEQWSGRKAIELVPTDPHTHIIETE